MFDSMETVRKYLSIFFAFLMNGIRREFKLMFALYRTRHYNCVESDSNKTFPFRYSSVSCKLRIDVQKSLSLKCVWVLLPLFSFGHTKKTIQRRLAVSSKERSLAKSFRDNSPSTFNRILLFSRVYFVTIAKERHCILEKPMDSSIKYTCE